MHLPREIALIVLGLCATGPIRAVMANTEIVNFETSLGPDIPHPQTLDWPFLTSVNSQTMLRVLPAPLETSIATVCEPLATDTLGSCPHEAWLAIDTDDLLWSPYSKFTLRVSWPASYPAGFLIDTYSSEDLPATAQSTRTRHTLTRRKYARIRLVSQGVFTPSHVNENRTIDLVPFIVVVEPLLLGVIPASLRPTLLFLLALVAVIVFAVLPRVQQHLTTVAGRVRTDDERRTQ